MVADSELFCYHFLCVGDVVCEISDWGWGDDMPLGAVALAALLSFAVMHGVLWISRAKVREAGREGDGLSLRIATFLAGVSFLRSAAAIATTCFGGLYLLVWLTQRFEINVFADPASQFFQAVMTVREHVAVVAGWVTIALISTLLAIVLLFVIRQARSATVRDGGGAFDALVLSRRLSKLLGRGANWLTRLGLATFLLSLLVAAPKVTDFAHKLDEIAVNRVAARADAELKAAKTEAQREQPEDDDDDEPDSGEYSAALDDVARAFERGVARSRPFGGGPPPPEAAPAGKGPPPDDGSRVNRTRGEAGVPTEATRSRANLRQWAVRQAILDAAARNAPASAGVATAPEPRGVAPIGEIERRALVQNRAAVQIRDPVTRLGENFRERLAHELSPVTPAKQRAFVEAAKRVRIASSRAESPVPRLIAEVVGELINTGIDGAGDATRELTKGLVKKLIEPGAKRIGETLTDWALARVLKTPDLRNFADDTVRYIETTRVMTAREAEMLANMRARAPSDAELWATVRHLQPTLDAPATAGNLRASAITEAVVARAKGQSATASDLAARYADSLATYGDFFPGRYGGETRTRRGTVLAKTLGGRFEPPPDAGFPGPATAAGPSSPDRPRAGPGPTGRGSGARRYYQRSTARARSFVHLRGFARVGGVLIGRDPDESQGEEPDIVGFAWDLTDAGATLLLDHRDGSRQNLGPYPTALVHHALAYAADGRPVTVTMTVAPPLVDLKILLHPALIDTPIGCRVIEIDRFVDRFMDRGADATGPVAIAESQARSLIELYNFAVAARTQAILDDLSGRRGTEREVSRAEARLKALNDRLSLAVSAAPDAAALRFTPSDLAHLRNPQRSPIAAKPHLFDPRTVDEMEFCADRADASVFADCLASRVGSTTDSFGIALDLLDETARPGPGVEFWSGVREQDYALDPRLGFLTPPDGDDGLWPFNFILQIAFNTEPVRGWAGDQVAADESPWEFPAVKDDIAAAVRQGRDSLGVRSILADVADFTILQRLFRAALADRLGRDFPLRNLVVLAEATAPRDSASLPLTPRWTPRRGLLEQQFASVLAAVGAPAGSGWRQAYGAHKQQCLDLLDDAADPSQITEQDWNAACRFDKLAEAARRACDQTSQAADVCRSADVIAHSQTVADGRSLRAALDVAASEAIGVKIAVEGCPPL